MSTLSILGFDPFFEKQLPHDQAIPARIASEHRGVFEVWSSLGKGSAKLAGRLARGLQDEAFPGVGDWVTLKARPAVDQTSIIDGVLERRSVFLRTASGRQTRAQVVAANVDVVFVVTGLDADYNLRRIERYLARVWASGAQPVVVLNKTDVCDDVSERIQEVEVVSLGVPVLAVSALQADGLDMLHEHLGEGVTAAFVGSSGAGKSTMINALLGEARLPTNEVRARDGRGCHTTTSRQLVLLPQRGLLIDTPGMRELQLLDTEGLETVFADIEDLSQGCRFNDCTHRSEPGCAVREAIELGQLDSARLEHFQKLEAEAQSSKLRHDERLRRQADRALGRQYARDAKIIQRIKRGR